MPINLPMTRNLHWNKLVLFFSQLFKHNTSEKGMTFILWFAVIWLPFLHQTEWNNIVSFCCCDHTTFQHMFSIWLYVPPSHQVRTYSQTWVCMWVKCVSMCMSLYVVTFGHLFPANRNPSICLRPSFPFCLTHFLWLDSLRNTRTALKIRSGGYL